MAIVDTAPLGTEDRDRAARTIEQVTGMPIRNLKLVDTALRAHCHQRKRDPLQEQLAALAPWDKVERLTEWLADHGCPADAVLNEAESLVSAYQDSPERTAMLYTLKHLPRRPQ